MGYYVVWLYEGKEYDPNEEDLDPNKVYGFVYLIENLIDGKKYIGKKFLWSSKTLGVTKTRKRKKKIKVVSDWKKYWGSSEALKADVQLLGEENFKRIILHLCSTKGECAYMEMKEQIQRDVLLKPNEYYNAFVGGKIHRNHLKGLLQI